MGVSLVVGVRYFRGRPPVFEQAGLISLGIKKMRCSGRFDSWFDDCSNSERPLYSFIPVLGDPKDSEFRVLITLLGPHLSISRMLGGNMVVPLPVDPSPLV